MRSRFPLILVGLLAICSTCFLVVGCSDDDNPPPTTGGDNQEELQLAAVTAQVNDAVDEVITRLDAGVEFIGIEEAQIDDRLLGPYVADTSETPADNGAGWWVIISSDLASGLGITQADSLQYLDGTSPVSTPVGADAMNLTQHYTATNSDTSVTHTDVDRDIALHFAGIDGTSTTVTGTASIEVNSKFVSVDSTVNRDFTISATLSGVTVNQQSGQWENGCPASGSCAISVVYVYQKNDAAAQTTTWSFDADFTNGAMSVDVTNTGGLSSSYDATMCSQ